MGVIVGVGGGMVGDKWRMNFIQAWNMNVRILTEVFLNWIINIFQFSKSSLSEQTSPKKKFILITPQGVVMLEALKDPGFTGSLRIGAGRKRLNGSWIQTQMNHRGLLSHLNLDEVNLLMTPQPWCPSYETHPSITKCYLMSGDK